MEHEQPQRTRWALLFAGLAVTTLIVWFDAAGPSTDSSAIVQPSDQRPAGHAQTPDLAVELTAQGIAAVANPLAALAKAELHETLRRPLFSQVRRPPAVRRPVPTPRPSVPRPDPGDLKLIGIILSSDGAVALIRFKTVRDTLSVREGEVIEGWTIEKIGKQRIEVRKSGDSATLHVSGDQVDSGQ